MRSSLRAIGAGLALSCLAFTAVRADDVTYTYDALGRLVRAEYAGGSTLVYSYDAAGNRTTVVYNGTNGAPTANPDSITTTLGKSVTFDPRLNDTDPDNDTLTITQINSPTAAQHALSVTVNAGQTLTYTPAAGFPAGSSGSDTFSYAIADGHGNSATGTVTMTVLDRPPVAVPDTVGVTYQTAKTFRPLLNDSDPDGDALTITSPSTSVRTLPSGATIQRSGAQIIYTPAAGFSGQDTFQYTISDGHGNSSTATETMNVTQANQPPVAVNDFGQSINYVLQGGSVAPQVALNPLLNDSDPDGDHLTVVGVTQPASGHASVTFGTSSVSYQYNTAVQSLDMTDSFSYTISDGNGHTATAAVTVYLYVGQSD